MHPLARRTRSLAASALLALAIAGPAGAQAVQLADRNSLTTGRTDWSVFGFFFGPSNPFGDLAGPVGYTASTSAGLFVITVEGAPFTAGIFNPGESILCACGENAALTLAFDRPITGFGANFSANAFGPFIGSLELFTGATSLGAVSVAGLSTDALDGSAPFLGASSATAFDRVVLSAPLGGEDGLIINDFSVSAVSAVPEPASVTLVTAGLSALIGVRWRRRRVR